MLLIAILFIAILLVVIIYDFDPVRILIYIVVIFMITIIIHNIVSGIALGSHTHQNKEEIIFESTSIEWLQPDVYDYFME